VSVTPGEFEWGGKRRHVSESDTAKSGREARNCQQQVTRTRVLVAVTGVSVITTPPLDQESPGSSPGGATREAIGVDLWSPHLVLPHPIVRPQESGRSDEGYQGDRELHLAGAGLRGSYWRAPHEATFRHDPRACSTLPLHRRAPAHVVCRCHGRAHRRCCVPGPRKGSRGGSASARDARPNPSPCRGRSFRQSC
jgi:hypothetical protein